jgi:hypothetical protein
VSQIPKNYFWLFKENVSDSLAGEDLYLHRLISEIDESTIPELSGPRELGVEIVQSLSEIIKSLIQGSVKHHDDIRLVSKGLMIGAFKSNKGVENEAHRTIALLVKLILSQVFFLRSDVVGAAKGIVEGIICVEQKGSLNLKIAASIAATDAVLIMEEIDAESAILLREEFKKPFKGMNLTIYKRRSKRGSDQLQPNDDLLQSDNEDAEADNADNGNHLMIEPPSHSKEPPPGESEVVFPNEREIDISGKDLLPAEEPPSV